jgi:hypothetical protein
MIRISIALTLVPALLAAPPSVEKLLNRPRPGEVIVDLKNGQWRKGTSASITDQFIALRDANGCENIPISDIAKVRRAPASRDEIGYTFLVGAAVLVLSPLWAPPYLIHLIREDLSRNAAFYGQWESAGGTTLSIRDKDVTRHDYTATDGHFRVEDQTLLLDGSEFRIRYDCESLVLTSAGTSIHLRNQRRPEGPASAPILGRWGEVRTARSWDFFQDGTYRKLEELPATFGKRVGSSILWQDGTKSNLKRDGRLLSVTINGVTEAFRSKH